MAAADDRTREMERWAAWALGVLAAVVAIVVSRGRMAVTADSVTYLAAATSLRDGDGLGMWLEDPLVVFPPAWPFAIAALTFLGLSASAAALVLIAASLIVIPPLALVTLRRTTTTTQVRLLALIGIACSPLVLSWSLGGLSEVPFVAVVLGCAALAIRSTEERPHLLWAAAALAAVAPLIRYAGIAVPVGLAAWVFLTTAGRRRWWATVATLAIGTVPIAAVLVRNVLTVDAALGEREPSTVGPVGVVLQGLSGVGRTFLWGLDVAPRPLAIVVGLVVLAAAGVAVVRPADGWRSPQGTARLVVGLLAASQIVVMAAGRTRAEIDDLGPRLLAPSTVLLLILVWSLLDDVSARRSPALRRALLGAGTLWCVIAVLATARFVTRDDVGGYEQPAYESARSSEVLEQLPESCRAAAEGPADTCVLVANEPWAWWDSDLRPQLSPRDYGEIASEDVDELRRAVEDGDDVYLVWTTRTRQKSYLMALDELSEHLRVELVGGDDELELYRLGERVG